MAPEQGGRGRSVPGNRSTIAERLRWAIDRQPRQGRRRGLRLFQKRMEDRAEEVRGQGGELVGYHLSSIQGYRDGDVEPSPSFLREAAVILGVREAWLLAGDGSPTEAEEQALARLQGAAEGLSRRLRGVVEDRFSDGFDGYAVLPHAVRASMWEVFDTYRQHMVQPGLPGARARRRLAVEEGFGQLAERFASYFQGAVDLLELRSESVDPVHWALLMDGLFRPITVTAEYGKQEVDDAEA